MSIGAVHSVTGIGRNRLVRAYRTTAGLAAAVYIEGHTRARALCAARLHPNTTAVGAVAACAHALLAQAAADPVVRALHALEMTTTASTTGLPSHLFGVDHLDDRDAHTAPERHRRAASAGR